MSIGTGTLVEDVDTLERGRVIGNHITASGHSRVVVLANDEYLSLSAVDVVVLRAPKHSNDLNYLSATDYAWYMAYNHLSGMENS